MATVAYTITSGWTKAADGPCHILIPAPDTFHWAIAGAVPVLATGICPRVAAGEQLSMQLIAGESLYVSAVAGTINTTVTTGA